MQEELKFLEEQPKLFKDRFEHILLARNSFGYAELLYICSLVGEVMNLLQGELIFNSTGTFIGINYEQILFETFFNGPSKENNLTH